jgi:methionyl-tRNA formyltransferase
MRILFVGNRGFSMHVLRHLSQHPHHEIVGVVSPPEKKAGEYVDYESFKKMGKRTKVFRTSEIGSIISGIKNISPDIGICAGWTEIIPEDVLNTPDKGFVGLHSSKLPDGRGGAPVNWSIIHGDDTVSLSVFEFVPEVDAGDVIEQSEISIEERDTVKTVYDKLTVLAFDLLDEALAKIERKNDWGVPQDIAEATYLPNRKPQDSIVDWTKSAPNLRDWVRALTHPYPGAFTFYEQSKLTIWEASTSGKRTPDAEAGEVVDIKSGSGVEVKTGDGTLILERVQEGDKPEMWGDRFADRYGIEVGDVLGQREDFPEWLYTGIRDSEGGERFRRETNLGIGEMGSVRAVACSHREKKEIEIIAEFDGEKMLEKEVVVDGWIYEDVSFSASESGSYLLKILFQEDGEEVDRRYLKIFVDTS